MRNAGKCSSKVLKQTCVQTTKKINILFVNQHHNDGKNKIKNYPHLLPGRSYKHHCKAKFQTLVLMPTQDAVPQTEYC